MQIKVNQEESTTNEVKVFVNAFNLGAKAAEKAWSK